MNEGLSYDVEVTLGDTVDIFLSDGGTYPDLDVLDGHSHIGVEKAKGLSMTWIEKLTLTIDNSDEIGDPATGPVEVRVDITYTFSVTALAFLAIGILICLVSWPFLWRSIREFRSQLEHIDLPTGPGVYKHRYTEDYEPTGRYCPVCNAPLVKGPVVGSTFCPNCNWAPPVNK